MEREAWVSTPPRHRDESSTMLYIEGPLGSGKTSRLITETHHLLKSSPAQSILVLCSNHARQQQFSTRLRSGLSFPTAQLPVYTYPGCVRNSLFNFWPVVENQLVASNLPGNAEIRPILSGMEDSELLLRKLLLELQTERPEAFAEFPGTIPGLLKQIIRRIRLRAENRLSRPEMIRRSNLLGEMCVSETAELERRFDRLSYALRVLDASKQLDVFHGLLESEEPNPIRQWLQENLRHLVVDDVDETTPAQQAFIRFIAPSLETLILAADPDGGSRRGYLNAYPAGWEELKQLRPGETIQLQREDKVWQDACRLLGNWERVKGPFEPLASLSSTSIQMTRIEMMDQVVADIVTGIGDGDMPGDMAIVLPVSDALTLHAIQSHLTRRGIPVQILTGTTRPFDHPVCRGVLYLLQLANARQWKYQLSPIEYKTILGHLLKLNLLDPKSLDPLVHAILDFEHQDPPPDRLLPAPDELPPEIQLTAEARERYIMLFEWLQGALGLDFERQLHSAFSSLIAPLATKKEPFAELKKLLESYRRQKLIYDALSRTGLLREDALPENFERFWLVQVKTGTVADTPGTPMEIDSEALVIGTPQKMIDFEVRRSVYFWLDTGSREWARTDNAPLYNAWVHSPLWDGQTVNFSDEFTESLTRTRAGHLTRSLMLLAGREVRAYASELDDMGFSQVGFLEPRLVPIFTEAKGAASLKRATLREDQQPILEYSEGTMAITAVPGAGKTFVNVELILELVERGVEADQILVLTYMDSAAKTLISRLRSKLGGITRKMPAISTIHSLAFRILAENDHALLLGFVPEEMEILDDYGQDEVLATVANQTRPEMLGMGSWLRVLRRGISHAKTQGLTPEHLERYLKSHPDSFWLKQFIPAYRLYLKLLRERGQLDFTDLILNAVQVLESYPEIRQRYQQQFRYIIEDEAQDSSRLLQRFIHLIGGDRPNLIRTGDTNQSITTTFSSAEPAVFREFIASADKMVEMNRSGRCAPEIIELANTWIHKASAIPELAQAFQPIEMKPVPGRNPSLLYPLASRICDMAEDEEQSIVSAIQAIRRENPGASIAVLPFSNEQVARMAATLQMAGVPAISLSEKLNVNPVFTVLLAYLKLLASPNSCEEQVRFYETLMEATHQPIDRERRDFLAGQALLYSRPETLADEFLRQLYYDIIDFSRDALGSDLSAMLIRMTDKLFDTVEARSNGYLCALQAREVLNTHREWESLSPLEIVIQQFEAIQRSRQKKRSFSELLHETRHEFVQVMTLHKAKGQEFDVVFMPFMVSTEIRFNDEDKLVQELDRVSSGGKDDPRYAENLKRIKMEERARLIYVGISRARRALFFSCHKAAYNRFHRLESKEPSKPFEILSALIQEKEPLGQ